jgi:hypothetical protein
MDDRERTDPVERLVERFLDSEAGAVDGRALLEQVRRTQHARRLRRRAALYALAASFLMTAALFLVHSAVKPGLRKATPPDLAPMAKVVREQEQQVLKGMDAVRDATALPMREALGSLSPAPSARDLLPDWSEAGRSLQADAREIKVRVDTLVSASFHKTGLAL